jgi:hypothetical protein
VPLATFLDDSAYFSAGREEAGPRSAEKPPPVQTAERKRAQRSAPMPPKPVGERGTQAQRSAPTPPKPIGKKATQRPASLPPKSPDSPLLAAGDASISGEATAPSVMSGRSQSASSQMRVVGEDSGIVLSHVIGGIVRAARYIVCVGGCLCIFCWLACPNVLQLPKICPRSMSAI